MTTTVAATTAEQHLRHIATQWLTLRCLLQASTPTTWPPLMGMQHLDRDEDDEHAAEAALERAERTAVAPGERPAPLHVSILDTLNELEAELLDLADTLASAVQRPAFTARIVGAGPLDEVARSLRLMAEKDRHDRRRWHFNMTTGRTGRRAATWLADRVAGEPGPFRRLTLAEEERLTARAAALRRRLDRTLGELAEDEESPLGIACDCGGQLVSVHGSATVAVRCKGCGIAWNGAALAARVRADVA